MKYERKAQKNVTQEGEPRAPQRRRLGLLRDLVVVGVIVLGVHLWQTRGLVSGIAPAFDREGLDGERATIPDPSGHTRVVHFFATWCGVCRAEEHNVVALAAAGDVMLVASASGSRDAVARYARSRGLTMPIIVDDGELARAYGVRAYPTTFFVDGRGEIDFAVTGYTTEIGMRVRRFFTR